MAVSAFLTFVVVTALPGVFAAICMLSDHVHRV